LTESRGKQSRPTVSLRMSGDAPAARSSRMFFTEFPHRSSMVACAIGRQLHRFRHQPVFLFGSGVWCWLHAARLQEGSMRNIKLCCSRCGGHALQVRTTITIFEIPSPQVTSAQRQNRSRKATLGVGYNHLLSSMKEGRNMLREAPEPLMQKRKGILHR